MRYLFLVCLAGILVACFSNASENVTTPYKSEIITDDEVYFFTMNGCPHCAEAKAYLAKQYPNLRLTEREISNKTNLEYFYACGAKFGLSKWRLGAPLFCMGQHYILGWDKSEEANFDEYIKPFLAK
ncbi:MAG: hypothetical protein II942_04480 [Alphaproteobacteria bacterium]|nr:hypothetical protein [Alphaproteobacteria bacterium]